ncbi:MAG: MFS transporter [Fibrobacteres bacterium]|nr:MFS transporter [Fibrobacterota bacterium]
MNNCSEALMLEGWKRPLWIFWSVSFLSYVSANFLGPIFPFFLGTLGLTTQSEVAIWTSRLTTATMLPMVFALPFWGMVGDRLGHKKMVIRAMGGAGLCLFLTAFVTNVYQLLALRILHGFLGGFMFACQAYLTRIVPREKTGFAFGALGSAASTAFTLGPAFGGFLADHYGFRNLYMMTGIVHLFAAAAVFMFITADHPETFNKPKVSPLRPLRTVIGNRILRNMTIFRLSIDAPGMILFPLLPLFIAAALNCSVNDMTRLGFVFSITGLGTVLGSLLLGKLGDHMGHRKVLLSCIALTAALYPLHTIVHNFVSLNVLRFFMGFIGAGIGPALTAIIVKHISPDERGVTLGTMASIGGLGNSLVVYFGGSVLDVIGFNGIFLVLSVVYSAAFVIGLLYVDKNIKTEVQNVS